MKIFLCVVILCASVFMEGCSVYVSYTPPRSSYYHRGNDDVLVCRNVVVGARMHLNTATGGRRGGLKTNRVCEWRPRHLQDIYDKEKRKRR